MKSRQRNPNRTALLITCSREEAERIRAAAQRERRSISGFVMNAVMTRFTLEERIQERREKRQLSNGGLKGTTLLNGEKRLDTT